MAWGTVTIGGVDLREEVQVEETVGSLGVALRVHGQESHPPSTTAAVIAAHHNVLAGEGRVLPVVFTDKTNLTGFYRVTDARSTLERVANGSVQAATWQLTLERIGGERDVEVESRVPSVARATDHGTTPVTWHAPAGGASTYYTGDTAPTGHVDRVGEDGTVRVHTGLPAGVSPRWTVAAGDYQNGAARLLFDGLRRLGEHSPTLAVWELSNGLVRVVSGPDGAVTVSCWDPDTGEWASSKDYAITVNGSAQTATPEVSVLRNSPEAVVLRLAWAQGTAGRLTVDLGLRRGARTVTGIIKRHAAATLGVERATAEAGTAQTGGVEATDADADGNRYVLGSSKTVTVATNPGGISKANVAVLDFFAGHEVGDPPVAGDGYDDLLAQYLGSTGERTRVVTR